MSVAQRAPQRQETPADQTVEISIVMPCLNEAETLATCIQKAQRAIAKECGIKFLVASAASWQAAGYLDAHLRAMRADFTEARRFAPSMLFIDEIDSIGSREELAGTVVHVAGSTRVSLTSLPYCKCRDSSLFGKLRKSHIRLWLSSLMESASKIA